MADEKGPPQLLALLKKSQAFAESLLQDNEHLRLKTAAIEERLHAAEHERDGLRKRIGQIQLDTSRNSANLQAIDEELNTLANLHIATWRLHSSLELTEVVATMVEICVNLVGADEVSIFIQDEMRGVLVPVSERIDHPSAGEVPFGKGAIGAAVATGEVTIRESGDGPKVVVPLRLAERTLGAVVIDSLLSQKEGLTDLDRQLFALMSEQGSTALFGAYLACSTDEKLRADKLRALFGR